MKIQTMSLPNGKFLLLISETNAVTLSALDQAELIVNIGAAGVVVTEEAIDVVLPDKPKIDLHPGAPAGARAPQMMGPRGPGELGSPPEVVGSKLILHHADCLLEKPHDGNCVRAGLR